MIFVGLLVTLVAWAALWCIGEAAARLLFGARATFVATAARLPLGLAASLCVLETVGYVLPMRIAAWLLLGPAVAGAVLMARRSERAVNETQVAVIQTSLVALAVGLVPVVVAGRFTAASMTNHDGTYYITTADWLRSVPWSLSLAPRHEDVPPAFCLVHGVIHLWDWRTGTPNLMASISSLSGLTSPQALAVVTALLFACVPSAAIAMAHAVGVQAAGRRLLVVGLIAACSAAPAFLAYQHMPGHLGAVALFPLAGAALFSSVRLGGLRRAGYTALLLGAGVALFADGAAALLVTAMAIIVAHVRRLPAVLLRSGMVALATALVAPFTILRAASAGYRTLVYRAPKVEPVFPQRGWLPQNIFDHLATLMGVDAWPPWPEAWPPNIATLAAWVGAIAGIAICGFGFGVLSARRKERAVVVLLGGAVSFALVSLKVDYLVGKVLLTAAAVAVPLCAIGASVLLSRRRGRWLVVAFAAAELFALSELAQASHWHVVDRPAHDRMVTELARLPAGSLIAFDGLGAPTDAVHDTQRAHRAALLADLRPVHPGLDGGFYRPFWCQDTPRPETLPARAYALQRMTSEHLTQGVELAAWESFRLVGADLTSPQGFIASWAPTHAWMSAETEAGGRVLRWGEQKASGTLRVVTPAPCARLRGELRVVRATATVQARVAGEVAYSGIVGSEWLAFSTRPFDVALSLNVAFQVTHAEIDPPDSAHALAVSNLSIEPAWQCGTIVGMGSARDTTQLPLDLLHDIEFTVVPPVAAPCSDLSIVIAGAEGGTIGVRVDDGPMTFNYMNAPTKRIAVARFESARAHRLKVVRGTSAQPEGWRLMDVSVTPQRCSLGGPTR